MKSVRSFSDNVDSKGQNQFPDGDPDRLTATLPNASQQMIAREAAKASLASGAANPGIDSGRPIMTASGAAFPTDQ
jgi:hypothetical protein